MAKMFLLRRLQVSPTFLVTSLTDNSEYCLRNVRYCVGQDTV